jgi:hypothetical protein
MIELYDHQRAGRVGLKGYRGVHNPTRGKNAGKYHVRVHLPGAKLGKKRE